MKPLALSSFTLVSAMGRGKAATMNAIRERITGLAPADMPGMHLKTYVGAVAGLEQIELPERLAAYDCRNNRLAQLALTQDGFVERAAAARDKYGAKRVGVVIGTSTSGFAELERAYQARDPQTGALHNDGRARQTWNLFSVAEFVRRFLRLEGPATVISTACSSSAKAFASAYRMMAVGQCDAAVVGGVDTLCLNTLYGFASLQLLSEQPCRPFAPDRMGISIGEAGGFALLEWPERAESGEGVLFTGYGESSDAHHMSSPPSDGAGAALAMTRALAAAQLCIGDIDYINMHGTGTPSNDTAEDAAVCSIGGKSVACSSTKGWTGHTLGAAGVVEAVIACLALERHLLPGTLNTVDVDPNLGSAVLLENRQVAPRHVLSNSFGFGGSNCSLVFSAGK